MSPKTQGLLIAVLFVFAFVMDSFFSTNISQNVVMANGIGPLSVQVLATGLIIIIGLGGVVLKCVGNKNDPDIVRKTKKAFKELRGDGR